MADYRHIILGDEYRERISFSPINRRNDKSSAPNIDDFMGHAARLRNQYEAALHAIDGSLASYQARKGMNAQGYYLDIELANADIAETALNSPSNGVKLMTFSQPESEDLNKVTATVYVTPQKKWLPKKLEEYETKLTVKGKHRNEPIINRIENIRSATILSLFADCEERRTFGHMSAIQEGYFELWMSSDRDVFETNKSRFATVGLVQKGKEQIFTNAIVVLVKASKASMEDVPYALDEVHEVRIYHPASVLTGGNRMEQQEWSELIKACTVNNIHPDSAKIAILDTGVNNGHPLLHDFVDDADCQTVISTDNADHDGHGTQMTGLALYGDMAPLIDGEQVEVNHRAMSIKMMPGEGERANDEAFYGPITEDAVVAARRKGVKVCCMASTEDNELCGGEASAWSAAIDEVLYYSGACDELMLVSAGNIRDDILDGVDYHEICKDRPIQSPAQSNNAITVGAYTEKVMALDNPYSARVVAERGDISPFSRTSDAWHQFRIKPEIVMEGGNIAQSPMLGNLHLKDLSLVTTDRDFRNTPFASFSATSAATALAAKLAAEIQTANPTLSALSIRALMVHSARWTDKMMTYRLKDRLKLFGYGVPDRKKAIASQETNATFIYEGELTPFTSDNDTCKYNEMHRFRMPWPKDILLGMGAAPVTMRITLSYYIQPSPGSKSYGNLYKYQSAGLVFDVKLPEETSESLLARNNKLSEADYKSKNKPGRWTIGIENRRGNTVQCDWIEGITAAQLAACGEIVVCPIGGWWNKEKLSDIDNRIKYSLVVSIETEEQDIYTPIANMVAIEV